MMVNNLLCETLNTIINDKNVSFGLSCCVIFYWIMCLIFPSIITTKYVLSFVLTVYAFCDIHTMYYQMNNYDVIMYVLFACLILKFFNGKSLDNPCGYCKKIIIDNDDSSDEEFTNDNDDSSDEEFTNDNDEEIINDNDFTYNDSKLIIKNLRFLNTIDFEEYYKNVLLEIEELKKIKEYNESLLSEIENIKKIKEYNESLLSELNNIKNDFNNTSNETNNITNNLTDDSNLNGNQLEVSNDITKIILSELTIIKNDIAKIKSLNNKQPTENMIDKIKTLLFDYLLKCDNENPELLKNSYENIERTLTLLNENKEEYADKRLMTILYNNLNTLIPDEDDEITNSDSLKLIVKKIINIIKLKNVKLDDDNLNNSVHDVIHDGIIYKDE